jgi:hypothetical protein
VSYYIHSSDQKLPDKARLGAGTLARLAELQLKERLSVDVLVAKAVQSYFESVFIQKNNNVNGGNNGRNKEKTEGVGQY